MNTVGTFALLEFLVSQTYKLQEGVICQFHLNKITKTSKIGTNEQEPGRIMSEIYNEPGYQNAMYITCAQGQNTCTCT